MIALMGSSAALSAAGMARFCSFIALFSIQAKLFPSLSTWYISSSVTPVTFVIITDLICRLVTQTISKPVRESLWGFIPKSNKYRSKIIVDVLAHRIGTSLAAFLANVPLLYAINQIILSSPFLTSLGSRTFILTDFTSVGLQGQDHIVWGVFATTLFITSAVYLGTAVQKAKQKTE